MSEAPLPARGLGLRLEVSCYEGHRAQERPERFRLGPSWHRIEAILDRWQGPDDRYFKVRAEDGNVYILRHSEEGWSLASYRRAGAP